MTEKQIEDMVKINGKNKEYCVVYTEQYKKQLTGLFHTCRENRTTFIPNNKFCKIGSKLSVFYKERSV